MTWIYDRIYINRIREAIQHKVKVIDVDGSYLDRKFERLQQSGQNVAPLCHLQLDGLLLLNLTAMK